MLFLLINMTRDFKYLKNLHSEKVITFSYNNKDMVCVYLGSKNNVFVFQPLAL